MDARIFILNEKMDQGDPARDALEDAGFIVATSENVNYAILWLQRNPVDLIISPVHLINEDVFDFLRWVRGNPATKTTPFILFCCSPSKIIFHSRKSIETAAYVLGATKVWIGDSFDKRSFFEIVNPLLPTNKELLLNTKEFEQQQRERKY